MTKPKRKRPSPQNTPNPQKGKKRSGVDKSEPSQALPSWAKGHHWLYGRHAVIAALGNEKRHCHQLLVSEEFLKSHGKELNDTIKDSTRKRPQPQTVNKRELDQFFQGGVHQGIAAQVDPLQRRSLDDLILDSEDISDALIIALDQATDPQNIGAVLRSSAAFGAIGVIIPEKNSPEVTSSLAKAACGSLERIDFIQITNLSRSLDQLKDAGFWSVGLDGYADQTLSSIDMRGKTVIVMGNEGSGLRRLTKEKCDFLAKIPITQAVESLNLSNATAVTLYEIARQKEAAS
jgi:23S rRNA (guanosine2251-2'-O)-methyltransferase